MKSWIKIIFKKIKNNKVKEKIVERVLEDADLLNFYRSYATADTAYLVRHLMVKVSHLEIVLAKGSVNKWLLSLLRKWSALWKTYFAVVADEVRALASRTHSATEEISDIIVTLQERTKSIVVLMEDCRQDGALSRDEAATTGVVLDQIMLDVEEISTMAGSVSTAIEQQTIAANEISKNLDTIREITEDTTESVALNSKASQAIADQADALNRSISTFKV